MGMGEEMMMDELIDYELWVESIIENLTAGVWTMADGEEIQIRKMKPGHIKNCVRVIERGIENGIYDGVMAEVAESYLELFKEELDRRFPPQDPAFANG